MFAKSVYLSIVLTVTMAVGGCIMWPGKTTYDTPEKPTGLTEGKTHKTVVLEKLGNPAEQTEDGRLALHDYMRTRRLHMVTIPWETPGYAVDEFQARLLLLVMYDENNIIERLETYKCKPNYKSGDPVCRSERSICGVLIEIDERALVQRYCDTTTVDYFRNVALVESLREPLRDAVKRGDPKEIKQLIAQGADIHGPGEAGRTPLLLVAVKKGHIDAARLLLDKGADVSETTPFMGYTALQIAAKDRNTDLIETLLAHGANVNAGGKTPLYFAASNSDIASARLLIAAGANLDAATRTHTPLSRAVKKGHEEMAKLLIAAGADVNVGPWGKEPLFRAVKEGDERIAKLLIAQGANVSTTDAKGRTPLHLAAAKGRTKLAELLLVNGADVNAKDSRDKTPLHLATEWRRKETIEVLKQHGAKE